MLGTKEVRALAGVVTIEDEGGNEHSLGKSLAQAILA
jgi:hypothetical protein